MIRFLLLLTALSILGGCSVNPHTGHGHQAAGDSGVTTPGGVPAMFSSGHVGMVPQGWEPMVIFKHKKRTEYGLVHDHGETVMRAYAAKASSGLMYQLSVDPMQRPWLEWRWKIMNLSGAVANAQDLMEDAPARIILGFDGDKGSLSFSDQILFETARVITGYDFPYATLMYEWHGANPVGSVAKSKRSGRIRTVVAESGAAGLGDWRTFRRNIVEDFQNAFGEMPGRLIGVGVLTDTDFSGETIETFYGDIRLMAPIK